MINIEKCEYDKAQAKIIKEQQMANQEQSAIEGVFVCIIKNVRINLPYLISHGVMVMGSGNLA